MQNSFGLFLLILIPAAFANSIPPLAAKLFPKFATSIDFGASFRGRRIFGDHKTIRGFISGTVVAAVVFFIMSLFITTSPLLPWYTGVIIGFCVLAGDAIKSFFKRQMDIPSGKTWFPFDQVDWLVAVLLVMPLFGIMQLEIYVLVLIVGFLGQMLAKYLGYKAGINECPI